MDASTTIAKAVRARWAVAAMFLMNGFLIGSWAPQIPTFVERLGITKSVLGVLILLFGLGAVVAMPLSGYMMARIGSRAVLRALAVVASFGLLLVALAPNVPLAALAMMAFGGSAGAMDVAMNANAVVVERALGRAIMSSSHAFWSLGGFIGGAAGGFLIQRFGPLPHAATVMVAALAVALAAGPAVMADNRPAAQHAAHRTLPRTLGVYLVGLVALLCMIPEGAVLDWSALYLQQELGADIASAGLAYGLFAGAMALMRFIGDRIRDRLGAVATLRVSSLVSFAGILGAALAPWPWLAIAAFALTGIGIANAVPIAFSAGGNQPGMASSTGMSVVTTMGYSGILLAPSAIGFTAERTGFAPVFMVLSALLLVVFLMAPLARAADFSAARDH